jgi:hypothetical protein
MLKYESALRSNEFLLITSGPLPEMARAQPILERTAAQVSVRAQQTGLLPVRGSDALPVPALTSAPEVLAASGAGALSAEGGCRQHTEPTPGGAALRVRASADAGTERTS